MKDPQVGLVYPWLGGVEIIFLMPKRNKEPSQLMRLTLALRKAELVREMSSCMCSRASARTQGLASVDTACSKR